MDDGSFIFESKEAMAKNDNPVPPYKKVQTTSAMHIGKDGGKSKTEVLYTPPPSTEASDTFRDKIFVDRTDQGYVTFNRRFTYLGSLITNDLEDSAEIHARIGKTNGILHSLNNLWRSKGLSVRMKK
jgi:hypothetical protein